MGLIFFLIPIIITFIISLTVMYSLRRSNLMKSFLVLTGLNFAILGLAGLWWFHYETDGLSQVFGLMIYAGSFGVIELTNIAVLFWLKRKAA